MKKGYLVLDDSRGVLVIYVQENEREGYTVAKELSYGIELSEVKEVIKSISKTVDLGESKNALESEKNLKKFN